MAPDPRVQNLVVQAQSAMAAGRLADAAQAWRTVLSLVPEHPSGLFHLGQHALAEGDSETALGLLERAALAAPNEPAIRLHLSFAYRARGNAAAELKALDQALAINQYYFPAYLAKGMALERAGKRRLAAGSYRIALSLVAPGERLQKEIEERVDHARAVVADVDAELDSFLEDGMREFRLDEQHADLARVRMCQDVAAGKKKVFTQKPNMLHFPGLPAVQFYDRALFPWLGKLESASGMIREELLGALREDADEFKPYIQHGTGAAAKQWAELNHSPKWSAFFLWKNGARVETHCQRCPKTSELLETLPLFDAPQFGPTVMFSALAEATRIRPHTGDTNIRLVGHLPLVLPEGCRFRVGNDTRPWREGEAWIFDDTIEHEAVNDSSELRVILIFDVWNPYLTEIERRAAGKLVRLLQQYNRGDA